MLALPGGLDSVGLDDLHDKVLLEGAEFTGRALGLKGHTADFGHAMMIANLRAPEFSYSLPGARNLPPRLSRDNENPHRAGGEIYPFFSSDLRQV